ncbi:universal stress protein [Polaribacter reichenbachii]|uniref:Universal stress protein n=1 Tax=Polaribacter reichenbachii TaxID=996801 RepID=A0A1B8TV33_9FLAO|nr:universal stress protein [Polaribacter reichenbachii]APZ45472.1 universal stress protein [Polaribacter reichenbachii]AUC19333.1 universal stress protein [Polaribacter reichenbachii]OBY63513.1 universal stress protein [Polaribacter reichenbachii]
MKRKILLPTDFSKNAWYAIQYALELYKKDTCHFYILNVFSATSDIMKNLINLEPGSELYEVIKEKSETGLQKVLEMLKLHKYNNPKHNFETISVFNNPLEAIKNIVEKKDIEMIVMGTKGATNTSLIAYGSTAIYVMEKVRNCPVIVVPEKAKRNLPKEIVFPTSYKTHYKRRQLNSLIDVAKKCNSRIAILHIAEEEKLSEEQLENKELLEEIFEEVNYGFHTLSKNAIETAIDVFVESRESDMVAFINKKHTFFGSILSQPLVKDITYNSNTPILVMHDLRN